MMKTGSSGIPSFRFRPTGYGLLFFLVLAAITVGALNYHANLGLLLAFLLTSIAAVSVLHTYHNLRGLKVLSASARPVFAGQTAVFELELSAGASETTLVAFSFSGNDKMQANVALGPKRRVAVPAPADRRGVLSPGSLNIDTRYPLGLFACRACLTLDARCLVYPRPLAGAPTVARAPEAADGQNSSSGSGSDDFKGLQPYQPGEPIEHIYWKAYSKGQGLFRKHFAKSTGKALLFDWDAVSGGLEKRLSLLCDAVLKSHRRNLAYGLKLPGRTLFPDRGEAHLKTVLRELALFRLPPDSPDAPPQ